MGLPAYLPGPIKGPLGPRPEPKAWHLFASLLLRRRGSRPQDNMLLQASPPALLLRDDVVAATSDPPPPTAKSRFDIESLLARPEPPRRNSLLPSGAWAAAAAGASPSAMRFGCAVGLLPFPAVYLAEQHAALLLPPVPPPQHRPCVQPGCEGGQGLEFSGSLGSPLPWRSGGPCKMKRVRTVFSPEQLERLEKEFLKQQYMVGTERVDLAGSLHLTETQVKVWFQNRRIKWRKQSLEQKAAKLSLFGVTRLPLPEQPDGQDSAEDDHVDVEV